MPIPVQPFLPTLPKIVDHSFRNCKVQLDGKEFDGCSFNDVTFVYSGGHLAFGGNQVNKYKVAIGANAPDEVKRTVAMLRLFGMLRYAVDIEETSQEAGIPDADH